MALRMAVPLAVVLASLMLPTVNGRQYRPKTIRGLPEDAAEPRVKGGKTRRMLQLEYPEIFNLAAGKILDKKACGKLGKVPIHFHDKNDPGKLGKAPIHIYDANGCSKVPVGKDGKEGKAGDILDGTSVKYGKGKGVTYEPSVMPYKGSTRSPMPSPWPSASPLAMPTSSPKPKPTFSPLSQPPEPLPVEPTRYPSPSPAAAPITSLSGSQTISLEPSAVVFDTIPIAPDGSAIFTTAPISRPTSQPTPTAAEAPIARPTSQPTPLPTAVSGLPGGETSPSPTSTSPAGSPWSTPSPNGSPSASGGPHASPNAPSTPVASPSAEIGSPAVSPSSSSSPDASPGSTVSPVASPSNSGSPAGSPSAVGSLTTSPTASGGIPAGSPSASGSPDASPSSGGGSPAGSPSATGSPDGSSSAGGGSPAGSPSSSGSPADATGSPDGSPSPVGSPSASGSPAGLPSTTGSPAGSPSTGGGSPAGSPSATGSPEGSLSPGGSPSLTGSPAGSPNAGGGNPSGSPNASASPAGTPSTTGSPDGSPNTGSGSPAGSPSVSGSPAGSPSATGSPDGSPSATGSPAGSPSAGGVSPSGSPPSASGSPAGSPPSASGSPAGSPNTTGSPDGSSSAGSGSPAGSPSGSGSPNVSPSATTRPDASPNTTASPDVTPAPTQVSGATLSPAASLPPTLATDVVSPTLSPGNGLFSECENGGPEDESNSMEMEVLFQYAMILKAEGDAETAVATVEPRLHKRIGMAFLTCIFDAKRKLQKAEKSEDFALINLSSLPVDTVSTKPCGADVDFEESQECRLINAGFRAKLFVISTNEAVIQALGEFLRRLMASGLLNDADPNIEKLIFMGFPSGSVVIHPTPNDPTDVAGANASVTSTGLNTGGIIGGAVAVAVAAAAVVLVLLLTYRKKQRQAGSEEYLKQLDDVSLLSIDVETNAVDSDKDSPKRAVIYPGSDGDDMSSDADVYTEEATEWNHDVKTCQSSTCQICLEHKLQMPSFVPTKTMLKQTQRDLGPTQHASEDRRYKTDDTVDL